MPLENVMSCPICGNTKFNNFLFCQDYTTSQEKFNLSSCGNCNFVVTSPRPDNNSIGKYYQSDSYISHTGSRKGLLNFIYLFARRYTLRWKINMLHEYNLSGSILDYGCGTGEFLKKCNESGFDITGIEPSDEARKRAEILIGKTLESNSNQVANKKFDIITLWHVLEHVADLKEKLFELKQMLRENGTIIIAVPNHESYDAKLYQEYWAGYDVPRHLWHFSKENMKALLLEANLKLLEVKPMKLDSFYVSLLSENYKHPEKHKILKFIAGLLTGLRSNRSARRNMNYSSLIYIAKP